MRGSSAALLFGQSEVSLQLLSQQVDVGALGFVQPNPEVAALAYRSLTQPDESLPQHGVAFDLYAGAGITTRMLAQDFAKVVACESHPESARALGIAPESVEEFLARELASTTPHGPELVIANPPRKGLTADVCAALLQLGAPRVHIMSCGPEGLARDLAALAPAYQLVSLEAFDTLPQTPHVELVAKLVRRPPP
jgi:23S rRNA (uracil1939-C5)-methyltransferase